MASIKKYATAQGTAWRVQYRSPDGRSRTKQGFKTKTEAQTWAADNTINIHTGKWINQNLSKKRIENYHDTFFATKAHLSPTSLHVMKSSWTNWVEPKWGKRQVGSIQRTEVQTWLSEHTDQAVSIRRAHGILAGILDIAKEEGAITENLARGVILPRKPSPKHVYLSMEQLVALHNECSKHKELVLLLGTVGLRWGKATGLKVSDIPDIGERIHITRAIKWAGRKMHVGELKGRENRVVSVPASVMESLRKLCVGKNADDWVFSESAGNPLGLLQSGSWFDCAVDRLLKGNPAVLPSRITPHGLRHVAAGLMISSGANVKVVQYQLGHKDASVTLNTYAALFDSDLDQIGVALEESLANVVGLSWDRHSGA
ncbi:putative phage-related integrase [Corynebacterium kutscheri]|uniref:site-specific integrase n=1 Tax=Corynebacterium kutscheri TaxID=35755 RepID=UPI000F717925|nr:site-specific integrase [Corynebacterium kutscheri]VEH79474.1 putative phage-related integrase [Corynebacterium kutscheri]VEH82498.1 putative phage-related integrase [Corynebacterium kutscheri]